MSSTNDLLTVKCSPADYQIKLTTTALLLIDMQRDFLERGGFGDALGGNEIGKLLIPHHPQETVPKSAVFPEIYHHGC